MNHAVAVRVVQCTTDRDRDAQGFVHGELSLTGKSGPQTLALDKRHHVEQQPVHFAAVEERKQVRMLQIGGDADLAQESLDAEHGTKLWIEQLHGDAPVVPHVASEIDGGHSTFAYLALDLVPVGEGDREAGQLIHSPIG